MENRRFKNLLSVSEVSEYLNIPLKSVYYLTEKGKINGIKIGKHWRYHLEEIENYYVYGTNKKSLFPLQKSTAILERRYCPRINCNLRCQYKIDIPFLKEFSSVGDIRDISGNGIFLYCKPDAISQLEIDDPINLDFYLTLEKGEMIKMAASGRIVRKVSDGAGVKFRTIDKGLKDLILKFVG